MIPKDINLMYNIFLKINLQMIDYKWTKFLTTTYQPPLNCLPPLPSFGGPLVGIKKYREMLEISNLLLRDRYHDDVKLIHCDL